MKMRYCAMALTIALGACVLFGCAEKKKERSITIEGPEKKTTFKMETTEKKKDKKDSKD